jgi:predicted DNA-binding protein
MSERENKQYSVQLDSEVIEKIDFYAKKYDIPRGKLMRNLIIIGLDDMNILHKAGILHAVQFTDKVVTAVKNLISGEKIYVGENGKLKIVE